MSGLSTIQTDFQSYVLEGDDCAAQHVVGSARGTAEQRLDVYFQAYRLRLLEVLGSNYPGLKGMLGNDDFTSVGSAYIDKYPSVQASIRWFGNGLTEFLEETFTDRPYWAEMARFDRGRDKAFDAADEKTVSAEQLSRLSSEAWADLRFEFHPSVRNLKFSWNVCDIWCSCRDDEPLPEPLFLTRCANVMIWRQELTVCWRSMPHDETAALLAAMNHESFSDLCACLCQWHSPAEVPARGAGMLKQWITDGLIVRLDC